MHFRPARSGAAWCAKKGWPGRDVSSDGGGSDSHLRAGIRWSTWTLVEDLLLWRLVDVVFRGAAAYELSETEIGEDRKCERPRFAQTRSDR